MIKIFSKKWLISFLLISFIGIAIALACADGWYEDEYSSNITPEAFVNKKYSPFFFSFDFYYGIYYDNNQINRYDSINTEDWNTYLGKKIPKKELNYLLQNASLKTVDSIYKNYKNQQALSDSLLSLNKMENNLKKSFLTYVYLAKNAEPASIRYSENDWYHYSNNTEETASLDEPHLIELLKTQLNRTQDNFLKQRYLLQLMKYYFYIGKNVPELFKSYENKFPKNEIYYRYLSYLAGYYYKKKQYSQANYLYSIVFQNSDILKTTAHFSFHPQEEKDWQETLKLCKTAEEKETLWLMLGVFYHDETRSIKEIYQLNPKSEKLNLLLARKINQIETTSYDLMYDEADELYSSPKIKFLKLDPEALDFLRVIKQIAHENKTDKPYFWHEAVAYLSLLNNDFSTSENELKLAKATLPTDELSKNQYRLLEFILTLSETHKITPEKESELLPYFQWLAALNPKSDHNYYAVVNSGTFRSGFAFNWARNKMSNLYKSQNEPVKAVCFTNYNQFYTIDSQVTDLENLLLKPNKTPYEKLCANLYIYDVGDLYEYQAIQATFDNKIDKAIDLLLKSDSLKYSQLKGNPFINNIKDCHDCDHASYTGKPYTKLSFLEKIQSLEASVAKGKEVYKNALVLGNAFYNMTHWGNARYFYEGNIIGQGMSSPYDIDATFEPMLLNLKWADYYYNMALKHAKTKEEKAQVHFMLAKCERNNWYKSVFFSNPNRWNYYNNNQIDFLKWNQFTLMEPYKNTTYYKEVLKECGYFKKSMK